MIASWRPLAVVATGTAAVAVFMLLSGMGPELVLVIALGLLVGLGGWRLATLADATPTESTGAIGERAAPAARADRRVMRLRTGLAYGRPDGITLERVRDVDYLARVLAMRDQSVQLDPDTSLAPGSLEAAECAAAAVLTAVDAACPEVKIGSYPRSEGEDHRVWITLEASDTGTLDAAVDRLLEVLDEEEIVRIERCNQER